MLPTLFQTQEEIIKKIRAVARIHSFKDAQTISQIFYDTFKLAYYALKRKSEVVRNPRKVTLSRKNVTRLVRLIDYHYNNDQYFESVHELSQCFGVNFTEQDALKFFEDFVEGKVRDKFGREIFIDLDDGIKFMYKNYDTNQHIVDSQFYLPHRGKRLPWIKHTLKNTTNIYTRLDKTSNVQKREIMYIAQYNIKIFNSGSEKCYWVVIVKKNSRDKVAPYKFKTAFPMFKYNELLRRIERYVPIVDESGI